MISRRAFVTNLSGGLLAAPLALEAQPAGRVPRIGVLLASSSSNSHLLEAFRQGLRELGRVEGQNIMVEYRSAEGRSERSPDLAVELVRLKVDVIVRSPTAASVEAKKVVERRAAGGSRQANRAAGTLSARRHQSV